MSEIVISESVFFAVHFGVNWPVPIDFYNDVFYIGSRGLSAVANLDVQAVFTYSKNVSLSA